MKRISIIIVTYNSEKDIYDCLDSIKDHADIPLEEIELIIVDNNSREPQSMFESLRQLWGEDIICIENKANGGYGQGNNIGIRISTAPVLLIMNPDVRLLTPFFKKALDAFSTNNELVMYGAKQMLSSTVPSKLGYDCTIFMNKYLYLLLTTIGNAFDIYISKYMYLSGSCFFIRKSKFEQVGLFDEEVFMYGEEYDIHYRLKEAFGPHFVYDRSLQYIHLIKDRKLSLKYEEALLKVGIFHYSKKGLSVRKYLKNSLLIYGFRLAKCYLRNWIKQNSSQNDLDVFTGIRAIIKQKLQEEGR